MINTMTVKTIVEGSPSCVVPYTVHCQQCQAWRRMLGQAGAPAAGESVPWQGQWSAAALRPLQRLVFGSQGRMLGNNNLQELVRTNSKGHVSCLDVKVGRRKTRKLQELVLATDLDFVSV